MTVSEPVRAQGRRQGRDDLFTLTGDRPRLADDSPIRSAAFAVTQKALDAWLALPPDAPASTVADARRRLTEALGLLGAVARQSTPPAPFGGRAALPPIAR